MKNKEFFYLQYNKINWENQEKTKLNSFIYDFIIKEIILKKKGNDVKIFDIGFGVGFFIKTLYQKLSRVYKKIVIEGCEPSIKNYNYFVKNYKKIARLKVYNIPFLSVTTDEKFDFITATYVFPHFLIGELEDVAEKINLMLEPGGQFILVVANEKYLEEKLKSKKDLFIEKNVIEFNGKKYGEVLHYSDIPKIGKVVDYNREKQFYIDLFKNSNFTLVQGKDLDDNGFICTIFVFKKK
jgi:2-polyprenyl-3-methyl-5-hydroxy-6-metoxy-1,4-benzoquinol methylase